MVYHRNSTRTTRTSRSEQRQRGQSCVRVFCLFSSPSSTRATQMDSSTHWFFSSVHQLLYLFPPSDWHFYFEVTVALLHVCVRACVFVHMDVALFSLSHYIPQTCLCYNHSTTASLTPSPVQETPWSLGSISVTRSGPSVFCCHLDLN